MEYTYKSVARLVSVYFFCLLSTSIFLHATFLQIRLSALETPVLEELDLEIALLSATRSVHVVEVEVSEEPIVIDHQDITGLKRIVLSKRKRNARKEEAKNAPVYIAAAAIVPSLPVAYNEIFDSLNVNDARINIIHEAKKYLGLKYVWGGTTPKGFDCSGFTSYILAQKGVEIARTSRYQAKQGESVDVSNAKTGDLIFFSKFGKGGRVTHVAMVVDNKEDGVYIIHSTRRGIVVDNLSESSYWKPKMLYAKDVISKG